VKEGDETYAIEVVATATNDNGIAVSKTSAATAAVLDKAPTISTPTIDNTAPKEGDTLTATGAVSGESDDPVTYQWLRDGQAIGGATGATYTVSENDETHALSVVATATSNNGVIASQTSAPTSAVIDNSSLTVVVSALNGVLEGQQLVASATITGDSDDLTAPVSFQWQSSSDGGTTWANAPGAITGAANGVNSFYQLLETDEGKIFRVQASFTDDTGQLVTAASAATVPVRDVAPLVTPAFSYAVDELSIVKNGVQTYDNTFSQAPPISPTILANGFVPTAINFITDGSTWTDVGGKAILSSSGVAPTNIAGVDWVAARLNTNTNPSNNMGLKLNSSFTVSAKFDLTSPTGSSYGLELNDWTPIHVADQVVHLLVQKQNGNTVVVLQQVDNTGNQSAVTTLGIQTLTAAQLAGNDRIEFDFTHSANQTAITGSFELIDQGTVTASSTFSTQGTIFTNNVNWTRAEIVAFTTPTVLLNVGPGQAPQEGQTLTASASTNDSDAPIHYDWQSLADGGQAWTDIVGAADSASYVVQEGDEGHVIHVVTSTTDPDNNQTASATSQATAAVTDAAPTVTTPTLDNTAPKEGDTLTASANAGQTDNTVSYAWYSSKDNYTAPIGTGSNYAVKEGDETYSIEVVATASNENGVTVSATSAPTAAVLDNAPTISTPTIDNTAPKEGDTVTASANAGQSDSTVSYAWYSSKDNYTTAIGTGPTYAVKEGDETYSIEVIATATNDNGVTISATSAATAAVFDKAPTITTQTIDNTAPKEGDILTASANAGQSDNTVSYAWYSSADN
jgi:hypothetical protein